MYSEEHKIVYVHIPKCAGLTVEAILSKKYNFKYFTFPDTEDHYKFLRDPRGKIGFYKYILLYSQEAQKFNNFEGWQKFTFVRDPYSRGISAVRYLHETFLKHTHTLKIESAKFPMNIEAFYLTCLINDYYYMHFILSQKASLEDLQGRVDFIIGRFENLMPDLRRILFDTFKLEEFDIEKVHANNSNKKLLVFNDDKIKEKIRQIHQEDFETFNYAL